MLQTEAPHRHSVQFYEEDDALLNALAEFAGSALGTGNACLVLATAAHRDGLAGRLAHFGVHVEKVVDEGRLILLDAEETLRLLMVDEWPDSGRFLQLLEPMLRQLSGGQSAGAGKRRVQLSVYGELVALLWADGKPEAAIRLEQMWNELLTRFDFTLLCGYPMRGFERVEHERLFREVCATHSEVIPCESYAKLSSDANRMVAIAELQQKAEMLQRALEERETAAMMLSEELSRRNEIEDALRKSEEFTRSIIESSADCIKVIGCDGRLVYISPTGMRALGIEDATPILGKQWVSFWNPAEQRAADAAIAEAKAGGVGRFEGPLTVNGKTRSWEVTISPMYGRDGSVERLVAVSRETTELRLAQAALMQSEKLATAGRLAATVAHEINNPLEAVMNSIYLAKNAEGVPAEVGEWLETADQEIARIGHIAQQTLGFYRDNAEPEWFEIGDVVRSVAAIYERKLHGRELTLQQQVAEAKIFARKGELKQVLSNLLTNAIDATSRGGRIVVRAHTSMNWTSGAEGMRILVADTGEGMSDETREKAFSAFFTTKAEVGTGIGLWITQKIVGDNGGSIRCRSRQGRDGGTVMNVFLPRLKS
ncbi:MAG TPA: ATP-binding protein [Acidobacteriaceae bacterium]